MNSDLEKLQEDLIREDLHIASLKKRAFAYMIDELLITVIVFISVYDRLSVIQDPLEAVEFINSLFLAIVGLKVAYQTFFIYKFGATIGKILTKTLVLSKNSFDYPNILQSLIRAIGRVVSEMFFYVGFVVGLIDPFKRTFHDKMAKTIVVDVF